MSDPERTTFTAMRDATRGGVTAVLLDAVHLEHRQEALAHVEHAPSRVHRVVGVVGSLRVGRVVPVGDHPIRAGRHEVRLEPGVHGPGRAAGLLMNGTGQNLDPAWEVKNVIVVKF